MTSEEILSCYKSRKELFSVSSFYSFLRPVEGRNVIRICKSVPCWLKNSRLIIGTIEQELKIKPGETTPDKKFTLLLTSCLGQCDHSSAMMVNDKIYKDLTPEKIKEVLNEYR